MSQLAKRCPHCGYVLKALGQRLHSNGKSHLRRCGVASTEERAHFLKHGDWRMRRPPRPHGGHILYSVWRGMISRCTNPNDKRWSSYGARGIRVCSRWMTLANFLSDMDNRPSPQHQIDRINNDGDYEPSNCRWATRAQQSRNNSRNRLVTWRGETLCVADWAARTGIPKDRIYQRLAKGWPVEVALAAASMQGRKA